MAVQSERKEFIIDASVVQWEKAREGAKLLMPTKEDKPGEIDFITVLGGRRSNLYRLFQVRVQEKGLVAMAENPPRKLNMSEIQECAEFILMYSASLDAMRSKQIVEILKSAEPPENESLLQRAMGRFRKS